MTFHVIFFDLKHISKYKKSQQMINRELTNLYLSHLDSLTEALYLCWTNSYCNESDQLNKDVLKDQILSYGIYNHKYAIKKEIPVNFTNKLEFRTLVWANEFVDDFDANIWCGHIELYKQVINEIENNLFTLKDKNAQVAYANILLRNLDKSHIHKRKLDTAMRDLRYKETFEIILSRKFLAGNKALTEGTECSGSYPNYDLTVRLINHLDFIDKLIELFSCFDIDLVLLAEKHKYNLYIFGSNKTHSPVLNEFGLDPIGTVYHRVRESNRSRIATVPKFHSPLSDDCLTKIMHYLLHKNKLERVNIDVWLYWFNRKFIKIPEPLKWKGSNTLLSNIIQHICGESNSATIKTAFSTQGYVKPTRKIYESGKVYKEIEQIITISKQKK